MMESRKTDEDEKKVKGLMKGQMERWIGKKKCIKRIKMSIMDECIAGNIDESKKITDRVTNGCQEEKMDWNSQL